MKKACQLDQTLTLPPIGARVAIHDDEETGLPHPGTVCGFGTATRAGSTIAGTTPLVPCVLVQLDQGVLLSSNANVQRCHVSVIPVHPDNLLRDEYGNFEEPLPYKAGDAAWAEYRGRFGLTTNLPVQL